MIKQDKISELFKSDYDSRNRRRSLLITTFIVCFISIVFTVFGLVTPLPEPVEEGQFVLIGLEPDGEVMDNPLPAEVPQPQEEVIEPEEIVEPVEEIVEPVVDEVAENNLNTTDDAEAPEVNASETVEEVKPTEPVVEPPIEPVEKTVEPKRSTEAEQLAELLKTSNNKPKGEPKGNSRTLGESVLKFNPETGFGSVGVVSGSGRDWVDMPGVDDKTQENGDVYIKVTVDRDGNVVEARNDVSRSTTTNTVLIKKALASAKGSKFGKLDNGPALTEEILKFQYRLK